ncbi:MAG: ABC transporter substrate-binding protein [Candidatus Nanopelagicales bacterium]
MVQRKAHGRWVRVSCGVAGIALLASGCGGGGSDSGAEEVEDGPITLSIATFNQFGYEDLLPEYEKLHPNITINHRQAATTDEARSNLNTRLAAGSGAADIEAVEVDWLPELMQWPDRFVDMNDEALDGRWLDWVRETATTTDGKLLGYGTDIGPTAICYRGDLFEKAGLPSGRDQVVELFGGANATWDKYFEVGQKFMDAKTGPAWFDSADGIYRSMVSQVRYAYENEDGQTIVLENPEVRAMYDKVLKASVDQKMSAHTNQWSNDWTTGFQRNGFATMVCPGWMLGVIEGNASGVKGWNVANVLPGGGGNWGGSYLTVPEMGAHKAAAKELAAWLTAPEQQIKAFEAKGTFPSQVEALSAPALLESKNEFFQDAPTGEIFAARAQAVTVSPYRGPNFFAISSLMAEALTRVDVDRTDTPDQSWNTFAQAVQALG